MFEVAFLKAGARASWGARGLTPCIHVLSGNRGSVLSGAPGGVPISSTLAPLAPLA